MPRQVSVVVHKDSYLSGYIIGQVFLRPGLRRLLSCRGPGVLCFAFACLICLLGGCAPLQEKPPAVFYPPLPQTPRLQFLTSISSEEDLGSSRSDFENFLLGPEIAFASLGRPYDIASTPGKIYVIDRQFNKLIRIDLSTMEFDIVRGGWEDEIKSPAGITFDELGRKYIADMTRKQVVVLDTDDSFLKTYGEKNVLEKPVDVAIWKDLLYVADIKRNQIVVFDTSSGQLVKTIGETGNGEGQFYKPSHIAADSTGNIFVNDAFNYRVQKLSANGRFIRTYGFHGDLIGGMARTKGIAVDRSSNLYVADAAFEYLQIFDEQARLLLFFGGPGGKRGNLSLPAGIHIDYDNIEYFNKFADNRFKIEYLLYVCNMSGRDKVNVYGFGRWLGE